MRAALLLLLCVPCACLRLVPPGFDVVSTRKGNRTYSAVFTLEGKECKFPFRFSGQVHHQCVPTRSSETWCSLTHNFDRDRRWGYCAASDATAAADPCRSDPCLNGGLCTARRRSFQCSCPEGFSGRLCSQEQCYEPLHLRHYGEGESWGRVHQRVVEQCACHAGKSQCELVRYTACNSNPCQNEAACRVITVTGDVVCACRQGFAGTRCSITPEAECYVDSGSGYRGIAGRTLSGSRCLPWNSDLLHSELGVATLRNATVLGLGEHHYCRNPDGDMMPWCYTLKDASISWEYCNIPKCQEKGRGPGADLTPTATPKPSRPPSCGIRVKKRVPMPRILGGNPAMPGAHPWMAAIYFEGSFCSGTLIAPCWVVSAAHCFSASPLVSQVRVVLGQHRFNDTGANAKSYAIDKYILPDEYSVFNPTLHDIALIKLKRENGRCAKTGQFVRPICLPGDNVTFPDYSCCDIAGWGHMYEKAKTYANQLMQGTVHIIPSEQCTRADVYGPEVTSSMLCAGSQGCVVDACQGDSGGPLACSRNGVYFLYGIISWGDGCGRSNKPGVYTRVSSYMDWIRSITRLRV